MMEGNNMSNATRIQVLVWFALIAGCSKKSEDNPSSTNKQEPVAAAKGAAPAAPDPKPATEASAAPAEVSGGTVETPSGPMRITGAEITSRFPPGCTEEDPQCMVGAGNKPMLVVWLEGEGGNLLADFGSASVEDSTGKRAEASSGGMIEKKDFLLFVLERKDTKFTLQFKGKPAAPFGVTKP